MNNYNTAEYAKRYIELGFVLCRIPPKKKGPEHTKGWNDLERCIRTPERAAEVWPKDTKYGVGAVLKHSNICTLDLDHVEYARMVFNDLGEDLDQLLASAPRLKGRPDRDRLIFRAPQGIELGKRVLVFPPRENGGERTTVLELRAGLVQDALPPTMHPDTKEPYFWVADPFDNPIPELPPWLLELWVHWDAYRESFCPWQKSKVKTAKRNAKQGVSVIGAFNQAHDIRVMLENHGYKSKGKRYIAPDSSTGLAGVCFNEDGRMYSHHASDPLGDGYAHDCFDVFKILDCGGDEKRAVKEAARVLGLSFEPISSANEWGDPEPLPSELPPVAQLSPAMVPEPLRDWIFDAAERMEVPPDFIASAALVALGSIVGSKICIRPKKHDDWTVVPNLWGAAVGRPALLKSPAIKTAMAPLYALITKEHAAVEDAQRLYEANKDFHQAAVDVAKQQLRADLKKGQATQAAFLQKMEQLDAQEPEQPQERRYLTSDPTVEALGELLAENPNGVLLLRDELMGWLKSLDKFGREDARAFFLESWAGDTPYTVDRIGRGTLHIPALIVSVFGGIQPGPLSDYVWQAGKRGVGDDGLIQRFQLMVYPDAPTRITGIDRPSDLPAREHAFGVFSRVDALSEQEPLRFAPDAQSIFDEWFVDHTNRILKESLPPSLESHLSKYRSLMPSLALLFHLCGHEPPAPVAKESAIRAVEWCNYLETHALRVYGAAQEPEMLTAKALARRIEHGNVQDGCTLRDIQRKQWHLLNTREDVTAAVQILSEFGWLSMEKKDPDSKGGRPAMLVNLNPKLIKQ